MRIYYTMPIQGGNRYGRDRGQVREEVYMRAYEVYEAVYGEQKALIDGECRGDSARANW